jgi:single-strand DNA-binding protein
MNKAFLIGNLTKDPEIKVTQSGIKLAKINIAVNEGKNREGQEIVQYFNLTAWTKLADIVEMYVKKGHKIAIVGNLQNRSWDKPDGSKGYTTDIRINELDMLTSKAEAQRINQNNQSFDNYQKQNNNSNQNNTTANNQGNNSEEEKLPEIDVDDINVNMPF